MLMGGFAHADSYISLKSDQGEYIGSGQEHELTGDFDISLASNKIYITHTSGFNFTFSPSDDAVLKQGAYLSAERVPFKGPLNPGIEVGSSGRGCNTISGEFYIYEMEYEDNNQVLAMDFVQYCDSTSLKLTGSIRLNSEIQTPYPFLFPVISSDSSEIVEGERFTLSGEASIANTSEIERFLWEYVSGPQVNIVSSDTVNTEVEVLDIVELGGEPLVIKLTVNDDLNQSESVEYSVNIKSKSDPQTYFTMNSETGDYIGKGSDWYYDLANSTITASKNYSQGVTVSISGSEYWTANFAAPDDVTLDVGEYSDATRYPFQDAGVAGLSISGNGAGCNQNYGKFTVSKLLWENEQPKMFKASFEQYCESLSAPLLSGEIAFNALHESVPDADAGIDIEVIEHDVVNLNGSGSFDTVGNINSYQWSAIDNNVVIENADESRANFLAPGLPDRAGSQDIQVSLLVTDDEGYQAIDSVTVRVLANNTPPISRDDSFEVMINGVVELTPLVNDNDEDGQIRFDSIVVHQGPMYGTFAVDSQGVITYTHTGSSTVEDSITYAIEDNDGALSNEATITITVKGTTVNESTNSSSGGAISYWLILFALIVIVDRRKSNNISY